MTLNLNSLKIPVSFKTGISMYPVVKGMVSKMVNDGDLVLGAGDSRLSSLIAATTTNTINNGSFTQEWQFPLTAGGTGFRLSNNRVSSGTSAETLMSLAITGSGSAGRVVKGLSVEVALPAVSKGESYAIYAKLTTVSGSYAVNTNAAVSIDSAAAGVDIKSSVHGIRIVASSQCINASGDAIITANAAAALNTALFTLSTIATKTGELLRIIPNANTLGLAVLNGKSSFGLLSGAQETIAAYVAIAASTTTLASLNLGGGVAPTSPLSGDIWRVGDHIYTRLGGVTYQLDQQASAGGDSWNAVDGLLAGARIVDMATFSLTFNNSGLFRIQDTGANTGIYDFNDGVDFLNADATKSFSILQDLTNGIRLRAINISGGITKEIVLDNTKIQLDSSVFKWLNAPVYDDETAATTAGLTAGTLYRTGTGVVRIKL